MLGAEPGARAPTAGRHAQLPFKAPRGFLPRSSTSICEDCLARSSKPPYPMAHTHRQVETLRPEGLHVLRSAVWPASLHLRLPVRSAHGSPSIAQRAGGERRWGIDAERRWQCLDLCQVAVSCRSCQVPTALPGEGEVRLWLLVQGGVPALWLPHLCK